MTVILINSKKPGKSGWANVRGPANLLCRGMKVGDILKAAIWGGELDGMEIVITREANTETLLPTDAKFVRIEHIQASGSPIDVDLVGV